MTLYLLTFTDRADALAKLATIGFAATEDIGAESAILDMDGTELVPARAAVTATYLTSPSKTSMIKCTVGSETTFSVLIATTNKAVQDNPDLETNIELMPECRWGKDPKRWFGDVDSYSYQPAGFDVQFWIDNAISPLPGGTVVNKPPKLLDKVVLINRLSEAGLLTAAETALKADQANYDEFFGTSNPVDVDDPRVIGLIQVIGGDVNTILAA